MNRKRYSALVANNCVEYFEKKIEERKDKIEIISKEEVSKNSTGEILCIYYVLEAEEGVIDSKYEL